MLISLHIENMAVIRRVDIDFSRGFTAMTGETGAGKSIIIDSIGLLMGKKAERECIRTGESAAMVSGLFGELSEAQLAALSSLGLSADEDGCLFIQRTISADGHSRVLLNGRSISLSLLRELAPMLISIHGQSDTHALTDPRVHLQLLDAYAGIREEGAAYAEAYATLEALRKRIRELCEKAHERERLTELLAYQIHDIDALSLHDGEEEELIDRKVKLRSSERIAKQAGFAYRALKGSEKGSVAYLLDRTVTALNAISDVIPACAEYAERMRDCLYQVEDVAEEVYAAMEDREDDPTEALNRIESRLDAITKLKRKYGLTVADILAFRDRAQAELEQLDCSEQTMETLQAQEHEAYDRALALADILHARRVAAAEELQTRICDTLAFLDMPRVVFLASLRERYEAGRRQLTRDGYDTVEFLISANRGAAPQPLARIASGGELARIMLAIKCELADRDGVSTVILDEIDAGVSGKTARKIGIRMLQLASQVQLLCVTHSAQIASLADVHDLISKRTVDDKTETAVTALDEAGRIAELSRILGGLHVTESQKAAATDMLKERTLYQNA